MIGYRRLFVKYCLWLLYDENNCPPCYFQKLLHMILIIFRCCKIFDYRLIMIINTSGLGYSILHPNFLFLISFCILIKLFYLFSLIFFSITYDLYLPFPESSIIFVSIFYFHLKFFFFLQLFFASSLFYWLISLLISFLSDLRISFFIFPYSLFYLFSFSFWSLPILIILLDYI